MTVLDEIATYFNDYFAVQRFGDDQNGIYRASNRPIQRFGIALEPWTELGAWVRDAALDALFLHRPWKLQLNQLPSDIGILAYHLAFDECLTLGWNPRLAEGLGMSAIQVLGTKAGRPIGMIGNITPQSFERYCRQIHQVFSGTEVIYPGDRSEVSRVAVVGAMTADLVQAAAEQSADLYITGQFRQPAQAAVQATGIGVAVVGHRRSELWGLQAIAELVHERWTGLEVALPPQSILNPHQEI